MGTPQVTDHFLLRKGLKSNPIVFPDSDYASGSLAEDGDNLVFTHTAFGADMLRYSLDFGRNWTSWKNWEDTTTVPKSSFKNEQYFWEGQHLMFQCASRIQAEGLWLTCEHRLVLRRAVICGCCSRRSWLQPTSPCPAIPRPRSIQCLGL